MVETNAGGVYLARKGEGRDELREARIGGCAVIRAVRERKGVQDRLLELVCMLRRSLEGIYSAFLKGFFYNGTFPERE